jgi:hypothetical protein
MKRLVILSLSLLLLLVLIPGCFVAQIPSPNPSPQVGQLPVIGVFSNNPAAIGPGGTSTLLWNVTGANSVSIDQGIGQVNAAGIKVISPAASSVYTITATNATGTVTRSAMTTVNPAAPLIPVPASFAVISAIAGTEPFNTNGCFTLYAIITANGPGTASYIWESTNGGGYSYTFSVMFPTAGIQKITLPVEMNALPSGPYRVHVLTPNDIVSNSTNYTTCTP